MLFLRSCKRFLSEFQDARLTIPTLPLDVLSILLTEQETYKDMADFEGDKLDLLQSLRPFKHGVPSHDAFGLCAERVGIRLANKEHLSGDS